MPLCSLAGAGYAGTRQSFEGRQPSGDTLGGDRLVFSARPRRRFSAASSVILANFGELARRVRDHATAATSAVPARRRAAGSALAVDE